MKKSVIVYGLTAQQEALLEAAVPEGYEVMVAKGVTDLIVTNSVIAIADMAAFSKDGLRTLLAYYMDVGQRLDETVVWLGNGDLPDLPSFVRCGSFLELLTDLEGIISRAQSRYDTMQMFCGGYDCLPKHAIAESMEADVYAALGRKCGDNPDAHTLAQVRRQWQAVLEAGAAEELATVYELIRWLQRKGEPYEIQCAASFLIVLDLLDIPAKPGSTPEGVYQFTLPQHLQPKISQWQQHHWNACGKMPAFVIGNYHKYNNLSNYRLDRITGIRTLDTPVKPIRQVDGMQNGLYLPKHMAEHLYMFSGESVPVTFRMKKHILSDVIDWFGTDIAFFDETEDEVTARVTVNWSAMRHWALQYCRHVKILTPRDLAKQVQQDLKDALKRYEKGE